jgi:cutinase
MKSLQFFLALAIAQSVAAAPLSRDTEVTDLANDPDFPLEAVEYWFNAKLSEELDYSTSSPLLARQYTGSTYNQLIDGTPCRAVTLIYARGTSQQGNVGDPAAVGPLFFNALVQRIGTGNLAVQGVTYSASIAGFLAGGDAAGSRTMASLTAQVSTISS